MLLPEFRIIYICCSVNNNNQFLLFFFDFLNMNGFLIVKRIDSLLKKRKESRVQLAKAIGINPQNISAWSIRGTVPPTDISLKIADYLGTSVEWLVTGESREAPALTDSEREVIENMRDMDERGIAEMVEISRIKRASVAEKPSESAVG